MIVLLFYTSLAISSVFFTESWHLKKNPADRSCFPHYLLTNEVPADLPSAPPQVLELSHLGDRPLVGALTSRLQALQAQLQIFVERVDSLAKPAAGGREPAEDEEGPSPPSGPADSNSVADKVNVRKHPLFFILSRHLFFISVSTRITLTFFFLLNSLHKFCKFFFPALPRVQSTA